MRAAEPFPRRWVVIGGGPMGWAIVKGVLASGTRCDITVVDSSAERRAALLGRGGFDVTGQLAVDDGDAVLLAVPPQAFGALAATQRHQFGPDTAVLSVMAGVSAACIAGALGTDQVVRCIPNTPSEVGQGMSVYFAGPSVTPQTLARAEQLLLSIGRALRVEAEALVDDATALCGGGPAFVSYLLDAFCEFAVAIARGFSEAAGRQMAVQVFGGTAALVAASGRTPMQVCREVMTPDGTTERGIAAFEAAGIRASLLAALDASASRSRELTTAATH